MPSGEFSGRCGDAEDSRRRLLLLAAQSGATISARTRQHREDSREREAHLMARDDRVEHSVREEKFRALKIVGELLIAGLLSHAAAGKTDQRARLGNIQI